MCVYVSVCLGDWVCICLGRHTEIYVCMSKFLRILVSMCPCCVGAFT